MILKIYIHYKFTSLCFTTKIC